MVINFKSINGSCPSFTYKKVKYFINDVDWLGERRYQLFSKKLDKKELSFKDLDEQMLWLGNQKASMLCKYYSFHAYQNKSYLFKVEKLKVTVIPKENEIGYNYKTYLDCLKSSKEFLETVVNGDKSVQLSIWDLPQVLSTNL